MATLAPHRRFEIAPRRPRRCARRRAALFARRRVCGGRAPRRAAGRSPFARRSGRLRRATTSIAFGHVLEGCRHAGVGHLVYASSSSVYGANHMLPFSEDQPVDHPVSLYAATKKANELMAHSYSHLFRLPTTGPALLHRLRTVGPARPWRRCCSRRRSSKAGRSTSSTTAHGARLHVHRRHRRRRRPGPRASATPRRAANAPYAIYNIGNHEAVGPRRVHRDARAAARTPRRSATSCRCSRAT